jgi:hypothetical protein
MPNPRQVVLPSNLKSITSGTEPTPDKLAKNEFAIGKVSGKYRIYGNYDGENVKQVGAFDPSNIFKFFIKDRHLWLETLSDERPPFVIENGHLYWITDSDDIPDNDQPDEEWIVEDPDRPEEPA